ncbi:MAG: sensor histidine kinase [Candidatus Pseudobacter hemicellulosilyticus]|uniref:Oxygen sensor histidine kinase NreB n=1 Tax=Candidatus Pseudobacter hemicellulosilyticus TaxID=3121375 RepID=A0AAJ5WTV7_9BACT|nr:MAG: sensor histidine kinase [Pseudobacter sp.]
MDTSEAKLYDAILIVGGVVGIVLLYFIFTIIRYQRRSLRLHKQKIQAEIETLENERRRIASDLHDELGPLLSAVKLHITSLDASSEQDQQVIDKSSMHIDTIIGKLREISNNLMPNTLIRKGLQRAISEFIDHAQQASGLQIRFVCEKPPQLPQQKEINCYRIIQEIVHNTIKHAKASVLLIRLVTEGNRLLLMTADNGKGFDYFSKVRDNPGLGLRNLQSRAEVMGAELSCQSEPGKGTMYTIEIPI